MCTGQTKDTFKAHKDTLSFVDVRFIAYNKNPNNNTCEGGDHYVHNPTHAAS